jgi:hypothetical protein
MRWCAAQPFADLFRVVGAEVVSGAAPPKQGPRIKWCGVVVHIKGGNEAEIVGNCDENGKELDAFD